ncbi:hypothetical protein [Streptomyces sp. NPDC088847]|uniref:hypothetical protein n=1 Tax=Streptomyces sp. NPDC088847 TaxID=3365909 RepID=UPI0037F8ED25
MQHRDVYVPFIAQHDQTGSGQTLAALLVPGVGAGNRLVGEVVVAGIPVRGGARACGGTRRRPAPG